MAMAERPADRADARLAKVVDLRAFARDACDRLRARAADPGAFLDGRVAVSADGVVHAIGMEGDGAVAAMPRDEFVVVADGALRLVAPDRSLVLEAGDAAVLPRGAGFAWSADPATVIFSLGYPDGGDRGASIVPISRQPDRVPSASPSAEVLLGPSPDCRNFSDYRVDDGRFACGTWDSTPYRRRAIDYGFYELMHLLDGAVTIGEEGGASRTFGRSDMFVIEAGAKCTWDSRVPVTKMFAIYRTG